jgi:riboflavin kinase/FMN adenylyltransferase
VPVWRSWDEVPAELGRTVVVIGNFDGVHRGHCAVVDRARALADAGGPGGRYRVAAITFDPHPMQVLLPERAPARLTDLETRATLLQAAGVDDVLVLPFTREVARWTPQEFVERILVETLHAAGVVVGENFRFGAKAAGDVALLRELGARLDFEVVGLGLSGGAHTWSSTAVRQSLAEGDVVAASEVLGRPVTITGVVARGDQRGRELGYPTANVPVDEETSGAVPADGVYAGWLRVLDHDDPLAAEQRLPAAISVGTNPTFEGERLRRVEAYVLDHELQLYDRLVEVGFVARVRGMVKFDSVEELLTQMADDVTRTRDLLSAGPETA